MRSAREIGYRAWQEAANLLLLLHPPTLAPAAGGGRLPVLPDPETVARGLAGSQYAAQVLALAERITAGEYPLFSDTVALGAEPDWRRDWETGRASGLAYFKRVPYLASETVGDHKRIWEPARQQHLVLLAQAALLGGVRGYVTAIERQIAHFLAHNPFQRGIHWASALEVAFRALSWIWVDHLAGLEMRAEARQQLRTGLYRHGRHLEENLSIYFSRNTHLLGEAVALHALGTLYPDWPRAVRWRQMGGEILAREIDYQVLADGADFEQSSYYHIYALDMFLFHWLLAGRPPAMRGRLEAMAEFLDTLGGPGAPMPLTGDDDGGRFFHPYGERGAFFETTLATAAIALNKKDLRFPKKRIAEQAAWWLGAAPLAYEGGGGRPPVSRLFPDAGLVSMVSGDVQVLVDAGGFGSRRGGHSHSDSLQILIRKGGRELLIDPGTYTYVSDRERRNWFRSTAAHNTVRVDGRDQGEMDYPFGWRSRPEVRVEAWETGVDEDKLTAVCLYGGCTHRRTVVFYKQAGQVDVLDTIDAGPGVHTAEQFWHFGAEADDCLELPEGGEVERGRGGTHGWRSRCFGQLEEADYAVARVSGTGRLQLTARIRIR